MSLARGLPGQPLPDSRVNGFTNPPPSLTSWPFLTTPKVTVGFRIRLKAGSGDVMPAACQGATVLTSTGVLSDLSAAVMPLAPKLDAPAIALANTCTADHAKIDASVTWLWPYFFIPELLRVSGRECTQDYLRHGYKELLIPPG